MKSFLNVVGMLALLGGILALLMAASAVHEILAGISILVCITSLGLAKVIALGETHLERTSEQRRKEREHWEAARAAARAPAASSLPPLPGTEKWRVEVRGQIQGPPRHPRNPRAPRQGRDRGRRIRVLRRVDAMVAGARNEGTRLGPL